MDLPTAVVLLALNLIIQGGLVALVRRSSDAPDGMRDFSRGMGLFGVAYLMRLTLGLTEGGLWAALADAAMVIAIALFLRGQRLMSGAGIGGPALPFVIGAVFFVLQAAVHLHFGSAVRLISLNFALAVGYLAVCLSAWRCQARALDGERLPQRALAAVCGVLGGATLVRAALGVALGAATLFAGPLAQAYYVLSFVCALLLGPTVTWWMFARLTRRLAELATQDALTGTLNRNGLKRAVQRHFAARQPVTLTWFMLDIDHFKSVNDSLGHAAGDHVLQAVAAMLQAHVRGDDFVARFGGEEFVIGCAGLAPAQAAALAQRLLAEVAALQPDLAAARRLRITVSIGVSPPFNRFEQRQDALLAADTALYAAKASGRNRAVMDDAALQAG